MYFFTKFEFKQDFVDQVQELHPDWIEDFAKVVKKQAIYSNVVDKTIEAAIKEEDFDARIESLSEDLNRFFAMNDIWEYVIMRTRLLTTIRIIPDRYWMKELEDATAFVHTFAEELKKVEGISYLKHSPVHIDLQVHASKEMELLHAIETFILDYVKTDDPYILMELEVTEHEAEKRIQSYIEDFREKSVEKLFADLEKRIITKQIRNLNDDVFSTVLAFASQKHAGQQRKDGTPYILHPVKVALYLKNEGYDIRHQIVGLCHDLLEDTDASEAQLQAFCDTEMLQAIKLLTKTKDTVESEYIKEILDYPMAKAVKNADRLDNLKDLYSSNDADFIKYYLQKTKLYFYGKFSRELDELYLELSKVMY